MDLIVVSSKKVADESNILYSEWVTISKFVTIAISLLLVLLVTTIITTSILEPHDRVITISLCGVLCLLFALIGWNYRGLRITITKTEIKVKYGLLNQKIILIEELINSEATKASFGTYFGFGVRIGRDQSIAFTTDFGEAVKLTYQENKLFVFSSRNSQKICNLLNDYIEN